jgi:hypothetical protein
MAGNGTGDVKFRNAVKLICGGDGCKSVTIGGVAREDSGCAGERAIVDRTFTTVARREWLV